MRNRTLILASLALTAILSGCLPAEKEDPAPILPGTPEAVQQAEASCTARGGYLATRPGGALRVCTITPRDANQACTTGADCEGLCLARSKTCAPAVPLFGCHEVIMDNGQLATNCLD
ncbi:hypothetical protein CLV78_10290 [Aliiruegeria haliotis]|uniref:Hemolysin n=1 Tax=Aliiruegeria haliotis TaxID=1280846 RepID=A0A2T0RUU1_9RHOB|nr:hypothetical protein [Aliiruegeria haliotis]PRY24917.1 hypothetical protein CLV78_10290 [Aliiruegeria haliotis]